MKTFKDIYKENDNKIQEYFDYIQDQQLYPIETSNNSFIFGKNKEYEIFLDGNKVFIQLDKKNKNINQKILNIEDIDTFLKKHK